MTRRRKPDHAASHERWLVSYADFMTLLFALFVVLYATAQHNNASVKDVAKAVRNGFREMSVQGAEQPASSAKPQDLISLQKQLEQSLGTEIAQQHVALRRTADGLVVSLRELGFFESGRATVLAQASTSARTIAQTLAHAGVNVRVEGHSDNTPIHTAAFASNWELSTARAASVAGLLMKDGGIAPQRVAIAGYGEFHPVASNQTTEGRRANRRVDIVILDH